MQTIFARFAAAASLLLAAIAPFPSAQAQTHGAIAIHDPWVGTTSPGAEVAAGYVTLHNNGAAPDRLLSATSSRAARVELHEMRMDDGVMRMRQVHAIALAPDAHVTLAPGGLHIMFFGVETPIVAGERISVTLMFEQAGAVEVAFIARPRHTQRSAGHGHH
ncbi:MAG TPA: copper chaperone PCu(A)C [Terricaulis sp.]|nr:copper chaperone PCu(A)C [Terricaulis sp.]